MRGASEETLAIFTTALDGGDLFQVTSPSGVAFKHDWSPDGERIVFTDNANDTSRPSNIATIRPDGTGLRYLTDNVRPVSGHMSAPIRPTAAGSCSAARRMGTTACIGCARTAAPCTRSSRFPISGRDSSTGEPAEPADGSGCSASARSAPAARGATNAWQPAPRRERTAPIGRRPVAAHRVSGQPRCS